MLLNMQLIDLYSYEHTGCQLENFECCNFEDSPFKAKNELVLCIRES